MKWQIVIHQVVLVLILRRMVKLPAVSTQFLQYFMYETESTEPTDSCTNVSMMQQVQFHFLFDSL